MRRHKQGLEMTPMSIRIRAGKPKAHRRAAGPPAVGVAAAHVCLLMPSWAGAASIDGPLLTPRSGHDLHGGGSCRQGLRGKCCSDGGKGSFRDLSEDAGVTRGCHGRRRVGLRLVCRCPWAATRFDRGCRLGVAGGYHHHHRIGDGPREARPGGAGDGIGRLLLTY